MMVITEVCELIEADRKGLTSTALTYALRYGGK